MNKERDILKYFEGELSFQALQKRYPEDDFSDLQKAAFYSKQIDLPKINPEAALQAFQQRKKEKQQISTKVISLNFRTFMKVAAVLVVMLTSGYFLFFNNTQSFTTEIAQTETLQLPDNSEVILNAQSALSFNKKSWERKKELHLDGEAFFKVTHGKTFTVKTDAGTVTVLGTQFNVKEREHYFEVQCYQGSVWVQSGENKVVLKPGKTFRLVRGQVVQINEFTASEPSWLVKESSFDAVPLWQVVAELQRQYGISIDASRVDVNRLYTGTFTHTNLKIALESVTIPLNLKYKIDGNNVVLSNYGTK